MFVLVLAVRSCSGVDFSAGTNEFELNDVVEAVMNDNVSLKDLKAIGLSGSTLVALLDFTLATLDWLFTLMRFFWDEKKKSKKQINFDAKT